jgi:polyisoprenyl-teichoic acid--peptidoglycan teichoic acid transferase
VAWSLAATGLCLGGLTAGTLWSLRATPLALVNQFHPPFRGKKRVNVLVMGVDDGQGGLGRSDTMLLVHVDTMTRRVEALSIPRDTRVLLGEGRHGKINAAFAQGGPESAALAVTDLTGLPIDYTLTTNFAGFGRLVDLVGGVDFSVEQAMDYEDHWAGLKIHLAPGQQHLDGAKAIQYVRFRKNSTGAGGGDGSDISRIGRQQRFLEALAARCLSGSNMIRLPEIIREGQKQIQTDLAINDLLYLGALAKEIGAARLNVLTVPGKTGMIEGHSFWLADREELAAIIRQWERTPPAEVRAWKTTTNWS